MTKDQVESWLHFETTQWFLEELQKRFDFQDAWYSSKSESSVIRLRGQRDVFEAIRDILESEP